MADFNTSKVDGDTVDASEWNQLASIDNFITTSGQTPSTSNLNQMGIAAARYSSGGQFFTDSGTANAYVLTSVSPFKSPVSSGSGEGYFVGMTIKFRAGNANTGASTVNVNSAGVKNLKKEDGTTDLANGDITTDRDVEFRYNGTSFVLIPSEQIPVFRVNRSSTDQTITAGVATKIQFNSESYDIGSYFDSSTNYRYLPTVSGKWLMSCGIVLANSGGSAFTAKIVFYKNGVPVSSSSQQNVPAGNDTILTLSDIFTFNGTTDYVEVFALISAGTTPQIKQTGETFFTGFKIR